MKKNSYASVLQMNRAKRDAEVRHHARVFTLDMVTIALGRMGWRETKLNEFDKVLAEVSEQYANEIISDAREDADMWYSKEVLDRELKSYVGKRFVPYDERYRY